MNLVNSSLGRTRIFLTNISDGEGIGALKEQQRFRHACILLGACLILLRIPAACNCSLPWTVEMFLARSPGQEQSAKIPVPKVTISQLYLSGNFLSQASVSEVLLAQCCEQFLPGRKFVATLATEDCLVH